MYFRGRYHLLRKKVGLVTIFSCVFFRYDFRDFNQFFFSRFFFFFSFFSLVAEMLLTMYNICDDEKEDQKEEQDLKRKQALRAKAKTVGKMMRMYKLVV